MRAAPLNPPNTLEVFSRSANHSGGSALSLARSLPKAVGLLRSDSSLIAR